MLRNLFTLCLLSLSAVCAPKVIRLEAEKAGGLSDQVQVLEREDASGGACVQLGVRGARNDAPAERKADATLSAKVPWKGNTVVWGRVLARNGGSDSLYLAGAGGSFRGLGLNAAKDWQWTVLQRTRPDAEGTVTLRLQYRELGLLMDEVVLVSGRDLLPGADGRFRRKDVKNPYSEPPFLPPKEHPRVFLRRRDIPALRRSWATGCAPRSRSWRIVPATACCRSRRTRRRATSTVVSWGTRFSPMPILACSTATMIAASARS